MNDPPQDEPQGSRRGSGGSVRGRPVAAPPNQSGAAEGVADQQADQEGGPPIIGVPIGLQGDLASVVSGPPLVEGGQRLPLQALHVNVRGADPYGRGASGGSPSSRAQSSAGYGFHAAPDPSSASLTAGHWSTAAASSYGSDSINTQHWVYPQGGGAMPPPFLV